MGETLNVCVLVLLCFPIYCVCECVCVCVCVYVCVLCTYNNSCNWDQAGFISGGRGEE